MLVLGTTGITLTKERGEFRCPRCGPDRAYRHRRVRRFFTVYFIPIVPLDVMEEYLECGECRGRFDTEVLTGDAAPVEYELYDHVKRVMILMIIADGVADPREVEGVQDLYFELSGELLPEGELRHEISLAISASATVSDYVSRIASQLRLDAQAIIVRYAFLAATLDGDLSPLRNTQLQQLPDALGMADDVFRAIIEAVAEE